MIWAILKHLQFMNQMEKLETYTNKLELKYFLKL